MKIFLLSASALVLLMSAAMAEPAPLSDGQLGTVAAGNAPLPGLGQLTAINTNTSTTINTITTTTTSDVANALSQSLTGGSSNPVYNVALQSPGALASGYATTAVTGMIAGAP